jgi:hypothetical protein
VAMGPKTENDCAHKGQQQITAIKNNDLQALGLPG